MLEITGTSPNSMEEAVNNALKHAGATAVTVRINVDNQQAELEVANNGRPFDVAQAVKQGGLGLISMRERAEGLDGTFVIESTAEQGTRVLVRVPTRRSWSRPSSPVEKLSEVTL